MKVSELSGELLDYWVFAAETGSPFDADMYVNPAYSPCTMWSQGGPIVEREKVEIQYEEWLNEPWEAIAKSVNSHGNLMHHEQRGTTPLIAAMRAYVASKFGNEVPDEGLQNG